MNDWQTLVQTTLELQPVLKITNLVTAVLLLYYIMRSNKK